MNISELLESWRRIIELARKPDREELMLSLKMVFIGFAIVGTISFIIRYIAAVLRAPG